MSRPADASDGRAPVAVALLNHRGIGLTARAVADLAPLLRPGDALLVVDAASGPDEVAALGALVASTALPAGATGTLVALERNLGVAGGYDAALTWAARHGLPAVLLANNDLHSPHPELLDRLVAALGPGIAAVGPLLRAEDGTIASAGGRETRFGGIGHEPAPLADVAYAVPWLEGSCFLVALDAVADVGLLDETYFLYWEEVDWCFRARDRGWRLLVEPRVDIRHVGGGSIPASLTERRLARNALAFARKRPGGESLRRVVVELAIGMPRRIRDRGLRRGRTRLVVRAALAAVAWNVRDVARHGWHGRRRIGSLPPRDATIEGPSAR